MINSVVRRAIVGNLCWQFVFQINRHKINWREREGVEPTTPTEGPGPTDLKSARPTGAHPLPRYDLPHFVLRIPVDHVGGLDHAFQRKMTRLFPKRRLFFSSVQPSVLHR